MEKQEHDQGKGGVGGSPPNPLTREADFSDLRKVGKIPPYPPLVGGADDFEWGEDPVPAASATPLGYANFPLIPCMDAWVVFAWDEAAGAFWPTVVDVRTIDTRDWHAWAQGVRDAGGFAAPVCLDASDAHDQSRALFGAHGFKPGYADRTAALTQFARLVEADWARDLLAKETR